MKRRLTVPAILFVMLNPNLLSQEFTLIATSSPTPVAGTLSSGQSNAWNLSETYGLRIDRSQVDKILVERPVDIILSLPTSVPLPGTIRLKAREIFTPNARVVVQSVDGEREIPFRDRWITYRGTIDGVDGSAVVLNVSPTGVDAMFDVKADRYYLKASGAARGDNHVLVSSRGMIARPFSCGLNSPGDPVSAMRRSQEVSPSGAQKSPTQSFLESIRNDQISLSSSVSGAISSDTIEVRIALEGDFDLLTTAGSVDSVVSIMVSTVAYASAIYERDLQVRLTVPYTRVWQTSDPYAQDMFLALDQVTNTWNTTMQAVERTITHLFVSSAQWGTPTGVAGIAHLNTLCGLTDGYGVTDVKTPDTEDHLMTFAHEVGHNFGAYHTHSCLWPGGPIDYCSTIEGDCYSGPLVPQTGTIMSYCGTRNFEFHPTVSALMRRNAEVAWCAPSVTQVSIAGPDSAFVQSLYSGTGGSSWTRKTNWGSGPIQGRYGVAVRNGRVVSINLPANNLNGALPAGLTNLTELRRLNLSGRNHYRITEVDPPNPTTDLSNLNNLTGQIPVNIGDLTALEYLDLSDNMLSGSIPTSITTLAQLRWLNLSENQFQGSIPTSWSSLANLELLDLSRNQLTGGIPSGISTLVNLKYLVITENGLLGGPLPTSLGDLTELRVLVAYKSGLTGPIPVQLGALSQLTDLDLSTNQLSGPLPTELGNLSGLTNLSLGENQLSGSIPSTLGGLQKLVGLRLQNNTLGGAIPPELGTMNLWALYLNDNQLTGTIPLSFGNLTQVVEFNVGGNQLTGDLPDTLRHIGMNHYPGLPGVFEFSVNDNQLTGELPAWLAEDTQFGALSTLKLGGNMFTVDTIPGWIFTRTSIGRLWLHDLGFTGTIPSQVGLLTSLFELDLSGGQLTGEIPPELASLSSLQLLKLSDNQLSGTVPAGIGTLANLRSLGLGGNQFSGEAPPGLANLTNIYQINLKDNNFVSVPDLSGILPLQQNPQSFVSIENNRLGFENIAPLVGVGILNITYSPQQPVGTARTLSISAGSDVRLAFRQDMAGTEFQWHKNGGPLAGDTLNRLQMITLSDADTGYYHATAVNEAVPGLTLEQAPIHLVLNLLSSPQDMTLVHPIDGSTGVTFPFTLSWNSEALATEYHIQVDSSGTFSNILLEDSVSGTTLLVTSLPPAEQYFWRARAFNTQGTGNWTEVAWFTSAGTPTSVQGPDPAVPLAFTLSQNYPNPFNPTTMIEFTIPTDGRVSLKIYDLMGREVATLVDQEMKAGVHQRSVFDASRLASGLYFARLQAVGMQAIKKMVLMK